MICVVAVEIFAAVHGVDAVGYGFTFADEDGRGPGGTAADGEDGGFGGLAHVDGDGGVETEDCEV